MKKTSLLLIMLAALAVSSCNNSTPDKNDNAPMNNAVKTDSVSGYADVNGLKIYYEIHGTGEPLVLIHGGGSTIGTTFGRILPLLAKWHKVIAVELQAHGHTGDIDRPLSFKNDASDVAVLLKKLNISKADIFGFSNGASTTLQLAISYPDLVNKIIVASTFYNKAGAIPGFWDMMAHASFEQMPQPLKDAYLKINPDSNALYTMYKRDVARMQSFTDMKQEDIKAIRAPALILIGDKDVVQPEHAVEMYRLMPNARLAILPGTHGSFLGEVMTPAGDTTYHLTVLLIEQFLKDADKNQIHGN